MFPCWAWLLAILHLSPQQSRVFQVPAVEIVCSACRNHTPATLTAAQGSKDNRIGHEILTPIFSFNYV